MYVVLVRFQVNLEFANSFRELVMTQAQNSLNREPECRRFDVAFNPDDPASCLLYELYDDRTAFDDHRQTPHFKQFDAAVADGVISKEVTFWELATGGSETISY